MSIKDQLEDIWHWRDCRDPLRKLRWKEENGVVMSNTIHYPVAPIKVKGSLANVRSNSRRVLRKANGASPKVSRRVSDDSTSE